MLRLGKIHITPEDYLARYEEYDDADYSYVRYFIEPYGPHEINEMSDTHYKAGEAANYHQHAYGYETFLIDKGSVEIGVSGKRALCHKGDMVHIPPYTPHTFTWLEEDTIWRELFQEMEMNPGMLEHLRVKEHHRERLSDPSYIEAEHQRRSFLAFDFVPELEQVSKYQVPEIRPFDFGLYTFEQKGVLLRLKVKRSETGGVKEIWQAVLDKGIRLSWNEENPFWKLFVVYSGEATVKIDGEEAFTTRERDIIHVPNYLGGEIITTQDTVLLDYNCQGFLFNALEELKAASVQSPEKLKETDYVESILRKHQCFISFENQNCGCE